MVSFKVQLLATILLISEVYSQIACNGGLGQRCAAASPAIIPGGQFIVPAVIKPLIPACQPAKKQACASTGPPAPCADDDDDSELDRLLYLLISNIIESKKGSGKKQSSTSSLLDCNAGSSDAYDACACSYGDDYDYCAYSAPVLCGGADNSCPEINVFIRPCNDC